MSNFDCCGIYKILNTVNGKFYVGSAVNIWKRWNLHLHYLRHGKHHSRHFQRAFVKYGEPAFQLEVLETVLPMRSALLEREQFYLDTLKPFRNSGYNVCRKADSALGVKRSDETRLKISRSRQGKPSWNKGKKRPPFSVEWKKNMARPGESNPFHGKKHSAETKATISRKTKERMSDPTKNYFYDKHFSGEANWMYGKTHSPEARTKIAAASRGRKHSDESRALMSATRKGVPIEGNRKAVIQLKDGVEVERFAGVQIAAQAIGRSITSLSACLHGKTHTCAGFQWRLAA